MENDTIIEIIEIIEIKITENRQNKNNTINVKMEIPIFTDNRDNIV